MQADGGGVTSWRCLAPSALLALLLVHCASPPTPAVPHPTGTRLFDPGMPVVDLSIGPRLCVEGPAGKVKCLNRAGGFVAVPLPSAARAIAAGAGGSCAMLETGQVVCWDCTESLGGPAKQSSKSSAGEASDPDLPAPGTYVIQDGPDPSLPALTYPALHVPWPFSLSVGASVACVGEDRSVACWGAMSRPAQSTMCDAGWLGNTVRFRRESGALRVAAPTNESGVFDDTVVFSLDDDGRVWPVTAESIGLPRAVDVAAGGHLTYERTGAPAGYGVATVAITGGHLCALLADGRVACWGHDHFVGGKSVRAFRSPASQLAVGPDAACAVLRDGTVSCWGAPQVADVPEVADVVRVRISSHDPTIVCAVTRPGALLCWGPGSGARN